MLEERIRCRKLLEKLATPEVATASVKSGMNIASAGEFIRGCPSAFFKCLAERAKSGQVGNLNLWSASLFGHDVEGILAEAGALSRRLGSHGDPTLRKMINTGSVQCNDIRTEMLPYHVRCGTFGSLDLAVVDAVSITEEGFIVPSHVPVDISSYVEAARQVIVEIDCSLPLEIEGMYDHYLPALGPYMGEIPLYRVEQRIGTPYIPVQKEKISHIVVSELTKQGARSVGTDERSSRLAEHLIDFLQKEVREGRLPPNLYPIEIGLGNIADAIMKNLACSDFRDIEVFSAVIGDGVIDLIEAGRCRAATGTGLMVSDNGWEKFCRNINEFKKFLVMRPCEITNHPELIRRLRVIAINGAIEVDIYGHVNSSHVGGVSLVNGIGGSATFAANAHLSIFALLSTGKGGDISSIVPMVSHVDHSEHCVDVVVTDMGLADLRGLSPVERAEKIIRNCAHPDFRPLLNDYLERSRREAGGHEPHVLWEAFSFHQRLKQQKTMKI
ncbi:acetyl-CoA hydrolase [Desulfallas sp. Bu1-1]|uniref:acetyl-CoA hydrolase/transferase C-terminal domain-containing protein n=1 Tax=Desulfallas sp. Bu1-1 TaxID=2787620 RepID=UPI00189FC451|nr:acetyl-CoA hydrolase/transferase C-terminal domain-containing protein [Desulfallas sp. Bu1-1]MBF7084515.1 acetyl-CoA hydrolase [Desulfallas sp. Bu1-1]